MPKVPQTRKPKVKRNISGLRNQQRIGPDQSKQASVEDAGAACHQIVGDPIAEEIALDPDEGWDPLLTHDSLKPCWEAEDEEVIDEKAEDMEFVTETWDAHETGGERSAARHIMLMKLAISNEDYTLNLHAKDRPATYHKGPDIGSRAERTKRRYRELLHDQTSLDQFGFVPREKVDLGDEIAEVLVVSDAESVEMADSGSESDLISIRQESISPPPLSFDPDASEGSEESIRVREEGCAEV